MPDSPPREDPTEDKKDELEDNGGEPETGELGSNSGITTSARVLILSLLCTQQRSKHQPSPHPPSSVDEAVHGAPRTRRLSLQKRQLPAAQQGAHRPILL